MKLRRNINDGEKIRISRTKEGTIMEVVTAVLLVAMWTVAGWIFVHVPDTVPTHFDVAGHADGYGSRWSVIIVAAVGTLASLLCLLSSYWPSRMVNMPVKIKNLRQHMLASRMTRILAVLLALLFTSCIVMMGFSDAPASRYPLFVTTALLVITPIYFTVRVAQARKEE